MDKKLAMAKERLDRIQYKLERLSGDKVLTPRTYAEKYGIDQESFISGMRTMDQFGVSIKPKTPEEIQWENDYAMAYIELEKWLKEEI